MWNLGDIDDLEIVLEYSTPSESSSAAKSSFVGRAGRMPPDFDDVLRRLEATVADARNDLERFRTVKREEGA